MVLDMGRPRSHALLRTKSVKNSFTASTEGSLNGVLWRWSSAGCVLNVLDDENRLGRL